MKFVALSSKDGRVGKLYTVVTAEAYFERSSPTNPEITSQRDKRERYPEN